MILIPDDPIISCIERTGWPPWMQSCNDGDESEEDNEYQGDEDCV